MVFWCQRYWQNSNGYAKKKWGRKDKSGDFRPTSPYISEMVQDRDSYYGSMCSIKRWYFQWPWVTPNYPKSHHYRHFISHFRSKLQLLQKPLDVLGTFTVRQRQWPCWGHLDSHGWLLQDLQLLSVPLSQITWLISLIQNGTLLVLSINCHDHHAWVLRLLPLVPATSILSFLESRHGGDTAVSM